MDCLGHLHCELASWHEDEPADTPIAAIVTSDPVDGGEGEGRRLACARRSFGEDVATLEEWRDGLPLDRRGFLVAELGERGDQRTANAQGVEFGLSG
jgi:hypothetical protein